MVSVILVKPLPSLPFDNANRLLQIRAANSLLSITHSMKLLLLLSDEAQIAHRRDAELKNLQSETDETRQEVARLLDELLRPPLASEG